jgi:hypothetical protein
VAAAVAGAIIGASVVSGTRPGEPPQPVAANIPARVLRAQARLDSLAARVHVVERGWHPRVPTRTYIGTLRYRAPESVALRLDDLTAYPSGAWKANNVSFVVDGGRLWSSGPAGCPIEALPRCTPPARRVQIVEGREPFAADAPAPLDLVLPAGAFAVGTTAAVLPGAASVAGRAATRVLMTAAQAEPLLAGLRRAGNWREVHPTDQVELWLDKEALAPLRAVVRAADSAERRRWAAAHGYRDRAGEAVLEMKLSHVVVNGPVDATDFPTTLAAPVVRDGGFRDQPVEAPTPTWVPPGLQPHREGTVASGAGPVVTVRSWSDGRAWLAVRTTSAWTGGRLFGDVGDVVRERRGANGVVYLSEAGDKVAVHGAGIDLVVTGTVGTDALVRVAEASGVAGLPVPAGWVEGPGTLAQGAAALPGLLVPTVAGFAPPAVRVAGTSVTIAVAGDGRRGFALVQTAGDVLSPPFDADVLAVRVRGRSARYTPERGQLEWVEDGKVVELRSRTLGIEELLAVAHGLSRSPS